MKPAAVRRFGHPPHATPPDPTPCDAASKTEKVLLTDFCNRPTSRAPAVDRPIPGVCPRHFRDSSPSAGVNPRGRTRGESPFDAAIPASVDCSAHAPADAAVLSSLNPGGLRYRRALEGTALDSRRCLPRTRCAGRPLTSPVANESRVFPPAARRQARLSATLRQERRFLATRDAFHRRVPARPAAPFEAMDFSASLSPISLLCRSGSGFRRSFTVSPREEGDG